jgi:phospholipid/cholesterol/gamma-HCH transport system permease protein
MTGEVGVNVSQQGNQTTIDIVGDWTLRGLEAGWENLSSTVEDISGNGGSILVDASKVSKFDISGAWVLRNAKERLQERGFSVEFKTNARLDAIYARLEEEHLPPTKEKTREPDDFGVLILNRIGRTVTRAWSDFTWAIQLTGALLLWILTLGNKGGLRPASIATHVARMGLGAIPIIAISTFLVGGVIAQQAAFQLRYFGAEALSIDLSSYMIFRELAVLIAAIMVAGRTSSAIAAEIGAMKMREEVDALEVMGLNPVEVLVIPRVVALMIVMPLLTAVACFFAIMGAATLVNLYSGFGFMLYLERMRDFILVDTVISTFIKTPFMAVAIGVIGCLEGLKVGGSTESLGRRTTSAVVKSIFAVFLIDSFFAIFFAAIEYG